MSAIELSLFGAQGPETGYIGWSPVPLTITGANTTGANSVVLTSRSLNGKAPRAVFMRQPADAPSDTIQIDLGTQNEAQIYLAGKFQPGQKHSGASEDGKDVVIETAWANDQTQVAGSLEVMIRVRRNANEMSGRARDDLLAALARLNGIQIDSTPTPGPGFGIYATDFVSMHIGGASLSEHGDSMFLPWHRLYLIDLERLLQEIDPAVTLPYWRFDEPAPNLFTQEFLGETEMLSTGTPFTQGVSDKWATFSSNNPMSQWAIGTTAGIQRGAFFDTLTEAAQGQPAFRMIDQLQTLALGGNNNEFGERVPSSIPGRWIQLGFSGMEGRPHGAAHISFNGFVNFVPVAPRDPLFFLLHCNVDRLWAHWQFMYKRDEINQILSYPYQAGANVDPWKLIDATQWPWDGTQSIPGRLNPPGTRQTNFTQSPTGKQIASNVPKINDTIDSYGIHNPANYLGVSYDDTPFDHMRATGQII